ncbi:MAG TPA: thioredoxin domain-containing protein [Labilithrix sp.]|nr:thioredoxin domain-containing protein [Labilithrix sp.]
MRRGLTLALLASLVLLLASCGAGVPSVIRDELGRAPPGVVTVVMFTDFQCPYCRRTHAALSAALADRPSGAARVRVVLRHVPLRMHPDAPSAARAAVCAESLPAYDDYVRALYASNDLGDASCEELAVERGANRETFHACVADPATERRIAGDTRMLDALQGDGVPLLYVGRRRMDGSQTRRDLAAAIDDAAREIPPARE